MSTVSIDLKPAMAAVVRDESRHRVVVAGRRTGKTFLSVAELIRTAIERPRSKSIYLAPSLLMSRGIAWDLLKTLLPPSWIRAKNEVQMVLQLNNGSQIKMGGLDHADALRGLSAHLLVLDEFAYANRLQMSWQGALRPLLSTTNGRSLWISTPSGADPWTREMCDKAGDTAGWNAYHYQSIQGGWIPPEEIEEARSQLDASLFRQEYCATWELLLGAVYPLFSEDNIDTVKDRGEDIVVGLDFNVSPFVAVIGQTTDKGDVEILRELVLFDANTDLMAVELKKLYPGRQIRVAPDPTGSRRQTSSLGLSDHAILRRHGLRVATPSTPWRVIDKVTVTRWFISAADGRRRLKIDPSCRRLIQSLRSLEFAKGRSVPDPRSDHGHACDSLGYLLLAMKHGLIPYTVGETTWRVW